MKWNLEGESLSEKVFAENSGRSHERKWGICEYVTGHSSHDFGWQSSHSVDLAGWQTKMAFIEIWIPWRNAHKPHLSVMLSPSRFRHMLEIIARKVYVFRCVLDLLPHKKSGNLTSLSLMWKKKRNKKIAEDQVLAVGCAEKYACLVDDLLYTTAQAHGCTDDRARARMQSKPPRSPADWTASFREATAIGPLRYQLRCKTTKRAATNRNRSLLVGWLFPGKFLRTRK